MYIMVKLHRATRYETMVNILDELENAAMGRFCVVRMTPDDARLIGLDS
jgi:hypothetical protein